MNRMICPMSQIRPAARKCLLNLFLQVAFSIAESYFLPRTSGSSRLCLLKRAATGQLVEAGAGVETPGS